MHPQCTPPAIKQHLKIAAGLSGFNDPESVFLAGNWQVELVVGSDLQKHAVFAPPLYACPVECRNRGPKPRQVALPFCSSTLPGSAGPVPGVSGFICDVGEQGEVVAVFEVPEMSFMKAA